MGGLFDTAATGPADAPDSPCPPDSPMRAPVKGLFTTVTPPRPADVSARRPKPQKPERNRKAERRRRSLVDSLESKCVASNGDIDKEKVIRTLQDSLTTLDPSYKRDRKQAAMLRSLATGLRRQGRDQTSTGVARSVAALVSDGVGGQYSHKAATLSLGMKRTAPQASRRSVNHAVLGGSSTAVVFSKRRKFLNKKFSDPVDVSVREFAYAYCKYEEKTYVSTLSADAVYQLYCKYHDAKGSYFPDGMYSICL